MASTVSATPHVSFDNETDHDGNKSDEKLDQKTEYETLFKNTMKMVKMNEKETINWKASEVHNSSLKAELP